MYAAKKESAHSRAAEPPDPALRRPLRGPVIGHREESLILAAVAVAVIRMAE